MKLIFISADRTIHCFTAYATHASLAEKKTYNVLADDYIIIACDLNGHAGEKTDGSRCHGGKGLGARNEAGKRIVDFGLAMTL